MSFTENFYSNSAVFLILPDTKGCNGNISYIPIEEFFRFCRLWAFHTCFLFLFNVWVRIPLREVQVFSKYRSNYVLSVILRLRSEVSGEVAPKRIFRAWEMGAGFQMLGGWCSALKPQTAYIVYLDVYLDTNMGEITDACATDSWKCYSKWDGSSENKQWEGPWTVTSYFTNASEVQMALWWFGAVQFSKILCWKMPTENCNMVVRLIIV